MFDVSGSALAIEQVSAAQAAHSPSATRSLVRGMVALFSAQPLTWAATFVGIIVVPRYLGAHALGQYAALTTIAGLAGTVAAMGVPDYLVRRIAVEPRSGRHEALSCIALLTIAATMASVILGFLLPLTGQVIEDPLVLWLALAGVVLTGPQNVFLAVLRGQERHGWYAWATAAGVVVGAIATNGALVAGTGLAGLMAASLLASIITIFANWKMAGIRLDWTISGKAMLAAFRGGLPFVAWTLTSKFYNEIDRIMLTLLAPIETVGWYAAANRIIGFPVFVPTAVMMPLFPALSRQRGDPGAFRATLHHALRLVLLLTVPLCALIAGAAPAIPGLLGWPEGFEHSVLPMQFLAPNLAIISMDMVLGTAVLALGMERKWLGVAVAAAIFNPAANVLLIPMTEDLYGNGGIGAAMVTGLTEIIMLVGAVMLLPRGSLNRTVSWMIARVLLAGCICGVVGGVLLPINLVACLAGTGLAYLVSVVILRVVYRSDLCAARALAAEISHRLGR